MGSIIIFNLRAVAGVRIVRRADFTPLMEHVFIFEFTMENQRALFHKCSPQLSLSGYVEKNNGAFQKTGLKNGFGWDDQIDNREVPRKLPTVAER